MAIAQYYINKTNLSLPNLNIEFQEKLWKTNIFYGTINWYDFASI